MVSSPRRPGRARPTRHRATGRCGRAEACGGRRGTGANPVVVVPGVETFEYGTEQPYADGLWDSDGDITLAGGVLSHLMVVRHRDAARLGLASITLVVPSGPPRDLAIVGHDRSVPRAKPPTCRLRSLNRRRDQSLGFCTSMTQTSLCWAGAVYMIRLPWIPIRHEMVWVPDRQTQEQMRRCPIQRDPPERGIPILIGTAGQDRSAVRAPERLIAEHPVGSGGVCHQVRRPRSPPASSRSSHG